MKNWACKSDNLLLKVKKIYFFYVDLLIYQIVK